MTDRVGGSLQGGADKDETHSEPDHLSTAKYVSNKDIDDASDKCA